MAHIEAWTRDVQNTSSVGDLAPQHTFLVKVNDDGTRELLRGGPDNDSMVTGDLQVILQDYNSPFQADQTITLDWYDPTSGSNPLGYQGTTIFVGSQASVDSKWNAGWAQGQLINSSVYDYEPLTQNCNTVFYQLARAMGLETEASNFVDSVTNWIPGYGNTPTQTIGDDAGNLIKEFWDEPTGTFIASIDTINQWMSDFYDTRQFETPQIQAFFQALYSYNILDITALDNFAATEGFTAAQLLAAPANQHLTNVSVTLQGGATVYLYTENTQIHYTPIDNDADYVAPWGLDSWVSDNMSLLNFAETLRSPIVLDLNGNGVELKHISNGVMFDIDNDGFAEKVGWVKGTDGLLVRDRNGNGVIDNVTELYGNESIPAFDKLRLEDTNGDRVLDANDTTFTELRVWQDADEDGITDTGELKTFAELGITSISLNDQATGTWLEENYIASSSTFTINGQTRTMVDAQFLNDDLNSQFVGYGDLTRGIDIKLDSIFQPVSRGYGLLPALHIAMSNDQLLADWVKYLGETEVTDFSLVSWRVENILFEWAGVLLNNANGHSTADGSLIDGRIVDFIDQFTGQPFLQRGIAALVDIESSYELNKIWSSIVSEMTIRLLVQGALSDIFPNAQYSFTQDHLSLNSTYSEILQNVDARVAQAGGADYGFWTELGRILSSHRTELGVDTATISHDLTAKAGQSIYVSDTPLGMDGDASGNLLRGTAGIDIINGFAGDDTIYGNDGHDSLVGGTGNDIIHGGRGIDRIEGNQGNDTIYGDDDNDLIDGNDGNDSISGGNGNDQIEGGAGADTIDGGTGMDNVLYAASEQAVLVDLQAGTGFSGDAQGDVIRNVEGIRGSHFGDTLLGSTGDDVFNGEGGNDSIDGRDGNDDLFGEDGNDTLIGGNGDDKLSGHRGNDSLNGGIGKDMANYNHPFSEQGVIVDLAAGTATDNFGATDTLSSIEDVYGTRFADVIKGNNAQNYLYGDIGNDTLEGRGGDDLLNGGQSNDTYVFNTGFGHDYISDAHGTDTIELGTGLALSDFTAIREGYNLRLSHSNGTDSILISYYYAAESFRVENIRLADGTTYTIDQAFPVVQTANNEFYGTAGNDSLTGTSGDDIFNVVYGTNIIHAGGGNDDITVNGVAYGEAGNDTLRPYDNIGVDPASALSDTLYGGDDDDSLIGGANNDHLEGDAGNDTLYGGLGNDTLIGGAGNDLITDHDDINARSIISNDTLEGGAGNDTLDGFLGDDVLDGGDGNDTLIAQYGNDTVTGGAGSDRFLISRVTPFWSYKDVHVTITDFDINDPGEVIDLLYHERTSFSPGVQFFDSLTLYDLNGDAYIEAPDVQIILKNVASSSLTAAHFNLIPSSPDIPVNQSTNNHQLYPDAIRLANGTVAVAWEGVGNIFFRFFDTEGRALSNEVQITNTILSNMKPSLAALNNGNLAVAYTALNRDGSAEGVFAAIYDKDTNLVRSEFLLAQSTAGTQSDIEITGTSSGGFFATWISENSSTTRENLVGRYFNASGTPITNEIILDTSDQFSINVPQSASLSNGNIATVWTDSTNSVRSLQACISNDQGSIITTLAPVQGVGFMSEIIPNTNGGFSLFWNNSGTFMQSFDASGAAITNPIQLSTVGTLSEVKLLDSGNIVVTYAFYSGTNSQESYAQVFDSSGNPLSGIITLNDYHSGDQGHPTLVPTNDNDFVAFWDSYAGQDGSGYGVFGGVVHSPLHQLKTTPITSTETYDEDHAHSLAPFTITSTEDHVTVTVTLSSPSAGSLASGEYADVVSSFNATTGTWQISGDTAHVNQLLQNVVFTPAQDYDQNLSLSYTISDGVNPSITGTIALNIGQTDNDITATGGTTNGTSNADNIITSVGADLIYAGAGDDIIHYSYDAVWQGSMAAWNSGSANALIDNGELVIMQPRYRSFDAYDGGDGYDILQMTDESEVQFLGDLYTQNLLGTGQYARLMNIEEIRAGGGDDIIDMSIGELVYGDRHISDDGANGLLGIKVYGEDGNDIIWTSEGNDLLVGGDGNDSLYGGLGQDTLTGGQGNDKFDFSHILSSTATDRDTITDFTQGSDVIDLARLASSGIRGFADLTVTYDNGNTILSSTSTANNFEVLLTGTHHLNLSDFIFTQGTNNAPVGGNDTITAAANAENSITLESLLGNDTDDLDGTPVFNGITTQTTHGSLSDNHDGTFSYIPDAGYTGSDSFIYQVKDASGQTGSATVNITVAVLPGNTPPAPGNDTITGTEDNPVSFSVTTLLANDTDAEDGTPNFVQMLGTPFYGLLIDNKDGTYLYLPGSDWSGTDSIFYRVADNNGVWAQASITFSISAVNDIPVLGNDVLEPVDQDTFTTFATGFLLANDNDVEDGTPSFNGIVGNPSHGTLVNNNNGTLTYTPTAGYIGPDSFTYRAIDSSGATATGTASIEVKQIHELLNGTAGNDLLSGGSGHDTIHGLAGNDTLFGDADNDTITGDDGNDSIGGNAGTDTIDGGTGADSIWGGTGNDLLYGGLGNDQLQGEDGDDTIEGNEGNDALWGGNGADNLQGNIGMDTLLGGAQNDFMRGGADDDYLQGDDGNDTLYGDIGEDYLQGNAGMDTLYGGSENDFIRGGQDADLLYGEDGNDALYGDNGADTLNGNAGDDYMLGGDDNDDLSGGQGNDWIEGGNGNDTIRGNLGNDTLTGDAGSDYFLFAQGQGDNYIRDFQQGTDRIDLSAMGANGVHALNNISISTSNGFTTITALDVHIYLVGTYTLTSGDFVCG